MTKQTYLEIIEIYGIDKVRQAHKVAVGEPFSHAAAIRHHESDNKQKLLESNMSDRLVAKELVCSERWVQILRQRMRDGKKKK